MTKYIRLKKCLVNNFFRYFVDYFKLFRKIKEFLSKIFPYLSSKKDDNTLILKNFLSE